MLQAAPGRVVPLESLPGYHAFVPGMLPPDYATVMTSWDGQWYWDIAVSGYPSSARGADGQPAQTSLAFFPLYPMLVRAVMSLTGTGFEVAAPATSLIVGGAAVLAVYALVQRCVDRRRALITVVLVCVFPSSPILQAAYTESLALLLLASALLLLHLQRYMGALVLVLLLGLTRNIALVLAPVVLLHWYWRVRTARSAHERHTLRRDAIPHLRIMALLVSTLVATALWPATAGLITGEPDAYLSTLQAWPGFTGSLTSSPLAELLSSNPSLLVAFVAGLAGLAIAIRMLPGRRRWGPELTGWAVAYPGYILAVSSASFSALRYLLLAFPLALLWAPDTQSAGQRRRQVVAISLVAVGALALQWLWVSKILVFAGPSGGWGFP